MKTILGFAFLVGLAGCDLLKGQQSATVTVNSATSQPVVRQSAVAIDVERPTLEPHVDGNKTQVNFNFNSGWTSNLIVGAVGLVGLMLVVHAYGIKRRHG